MEHCMQFNFADREFVEEHVTRIARKLGVTNGIIAMAVVDAHRALEVGYDRARAINVGVRCAAAALEAHVSGPNRRERPRLRLVTNEPAADQPPAEVLWHSWGTYALLGGAALLLAAACVFGGAL